MIIFDILDIIQAFENRVSIQMKTEQRRGYIARGRSFEIITSLAQESIDIIRVITGYFTVKGYNSVRKFFKNKKVALIVGIEDPGYERARKALVKEIIDALAYGLDYERDEAVKDLIARIRSGDINILDARALDHHAKVYIFDSFAALVASSNFTFKGLHSAEEAGLPTREPIEVEGFISDFNDLYARSYDITQELLRQLEDWLRMKIPWQIYLRTLFHLENYPDLQARTKNYRYPVSYQKYLVKRAILGLREFSGYMVVAQTGLGKTVIGTDVARQLHHNGEITHVLIIGPSPVEQEWKEHMLSAGIPSRYIIQQNLNFTDEDQSGALQEFLYLTDGYIDDKWLLIIDESHMFRNRYKANTSGDSNELEEKLAYQRLSKLVHENNAKILLLTGTPYSTDISDINDQLALLPKTIQDDVIEGFEGFFTKRKPKPWKVSKTDDLRQLDEVASVITTPTVIRNWALYDEAGNPYLIFGEDPKYFPRIMLKRINTTVFLVELIEDLLSSDILRLRGNLIYDDQSEQPTNAHIIWSQRAGAAKAWASSPYALRSRLENVISPEDGEEKGYKYSLDARTEYIQPIIDSIAELEYIDDLKLIQLLDLLETIFDSDRKVIIFCMYLPTVAYLTEALTELKPEWSVFGTAIKGKTKYTNRPTKQVKEAIRRFAPQANRAYRNKKNITFDIFITSDKYGVGVNMQDADTIINYDLPWDAIAPHQRAGRILRPWKDPRVIEIYLFVASLPDDSDYHGLQNHWEKLVKRHRASQKLLDLPVLTEESIENVDMQSIGQVIDLGEIDYEILGNMETNSSPIISKHMAVLEHNRAEAESIPDDIVSATNVDIEHTHLFLLLQHNNTHHLVLYDIDTDAFLDWKQTQILDLISCTPIAPKALVERNIVENIAYDCLKKWSVRHKIDPDEIERICTLYIKPNATSDSFKDFLQD